MAHEEEELSVGTCPRRTYSGMRGSLMATPVVPIPGWTSVAQGAAHPRALKWDSPGMKPEHWHVLESTPFLKR